MEADENETKALRAVIEKQKQEIKDLKLFNPVYYEVHKELSAALNNWPPFNSAHEGYAVLLEEVDELWAHVKTNQKKRDLGKMAAEAIQVAAMALRFYIEVCTETRGRK